MITSMQKLFLHIEKDERKVKIFMRMSDNSFLLKFPG